MYSPTYVKSEIMKVIPISFHMYNLHYTFFAIFIQAFLSSNSRKQYHDVSQIKHDGHNYTKLTTK